MPRIFSIFPFAFCSYVGQYSNIMIFAFHFCISALQKLSLCALKIVLCIILVTKRQLLECIYKIGKVRVSKWSVKIIFLFILSSELLVWGKRTEFWNLQIITGQWDILILVHGMSIIHLLKLSWHHMVIFHTILTFSFSENAQIFFFPSPKKRCIFGITAYAALFRVEIFPFLCIAVKMLILNS